MLSTDVVHGPEPYQDRGIVTEAEKGFFRFDEVDLGQMRQLLPTAIAHARMEDQAAVQSVVIERTISLLPEPNFGDVRWNIALATPRESATVYADARGTIFAADLSNTIRSQRLDLIVQDDWPMAEAQAALAAVVGTGAVVHELRVYDRYLYLEADHPTDPGQARSYSWDYSGVKRGIADTSNLLSMGFSTLGYERFALAQLDLAALPKIKAAALEAFDSPGTKITYMRAQRTTDRPGPPEVLWYVDLEQADGQEGEVVANTAGEILNVALPESRRAAAGPWNAPETLVATLAMVGRTFPPGTRFHEITLSSTGASAKIEDPQAPAQIADFIIDDGGASRFGFGPSPFDVFDEATLFTIEDLAPLDAGRFAELSERTLARMQMDGLSAARFTISRTPFMFDSRGETFIEIRAEKDDGWSGGRASYAIDDGEELDVVLP